MQKRVQDSLTQSVHLVMPSHLNGADRLFGGQIALWIDEIAGIVAMRHSGRQIVTACIDHLQFCSPVMQGEMVVMIGKVTYVGSSSMEIRVDSYVEEVRSEKATGKRRLINSAFLVEVAIDEEGNPTNVPGLILETDEEKWEFAAGKRRKTYRKQRNSELFGPLC